MALLIALIILVAMTLGGIALVRSMDTTNLVAGNLAFQQAATHSGEAGTEDAISTVINAMDLATDHPDKGYCASAPQTDNPADWDAYLATMIDPLSANCTNHVPPPHALPRDAAGYTVSYSVQRLCENPGDPKHPGSPPPNCASGTPSPSQGSSLVGGGGSPLPADAPLYYRITTRIDGPRNTVSYIQTIVAY